MQSAGEGGHLLKQTGAAVALIALLIANQGIAADAAAVAKWGESCKPDGLGAFAGTPAAPGGMTFDQCFAKCELTQPTDAECFDACKR